MPFPLFFVILFDYLANTFAHMLSPFEIMEHSWNFYRGNFKKLLFFPVLLTIVNLGYQFFSTEIVGKIILDPYKISLSEGSILLAETLLILLITGFLSLAFIRFIGNLRAGESTVLAAINETLPRFPTAIGAGLMYGALLFAILFPYLLPAAYFFFIKQNGPLTISFLILGLPLLIPALWLGVKLLGTPLMVILESKSSVDAIKSSFALVKGKWWAAFIRNLIPQFGWTLIQFLLMFVLQIGISLLVVFIAKTSKITPDVILNTTSIILTALMQILFLPLMTTSVVIWFEEMKK